MMQCLGQQAGHFDEMDIRNTGFEPDDITYSQVVFGLYRAIRLDKACKVLDVMGMTLKRGDMCRISRLSV